MCFTFCVRFQCPTEHVSEEGFLHKVGLVSASDRFDLISKWVRNVLQWSRAIYMPWRMYFAQFAPSITFDLAVGRIYTFSGNIFISKSFAPKALANAISFSFTITNYIREGRNCRAQSKAGKHSDMHVVSNSRSFATAISIRRVRLCFQLGRQSAPNEQAYHFSCT